MNQKAKKAFTLAEILITIGVLGVVAAMAIPSLIARQQKPQFVTALKKSYTNFNEALTQMAKDGGCIGDLSCHEYFSSEYDEMDLCNAISSYFKVERGCDTPVAKRTTTTYRYNYDGSGPSGPYVIPEQNGFVTTDGVYYRIMSTSDSCQSNPDDWSTHKTNNLNSVCGNIWVDVNGAKGPNNYGRDIFMFYISNGKGALLYPNGGIDDAGCISMGPWKDASTGDILYCDPSVNDKAGEPCAGRIIEENWQMNY